MLNSTARQVARLYCQQVIPKACRVWAIPFCSEGTVASYASSARIIVCRYCGLVTDSSMSHGRMGECVDALQREVALLRGRVRPDQSVVTGLRRGADQPEEGAPVRRAIVR